MWWRDSACWCSPLSPFVSVYCSTTKPHIAASEINTSLWQSESHRFASTHNRSHLDNYTDVVCYYPSESELSREAENKLNNKEELNVTGISPVQQTSHCGVFCFILFFNTSEVTSRVSSLKKRQRKKEIEGSSVLVVQVLKALYKRCVASFWYSDSPAYTRHYDTFGWSHCRINGPALSFSTTMPRFRDAISHTALRINARPKDLHKSLS